MTVAKVVEELRKLNNADRLIVVAEAIRLIRKDLPPRPPKNGSNAKKNQKAAQSAVLRAAGTLDMLPLSPGEIDRIVYEE